MPFSERISWAVGGMVLTAGLLFARSGIYFARNLFIYFVCVRVVLRKEIWEKRWVIRLELV